MCPDGFYEFGPYRLDIQQCVLLHDGQALHLTPKAINILLLLVQNSGRIVDKETLMQQVWPDTNVEEVNLAFNINILRKVLAQYDSTHQYIETIRKRGYRFVPPATNVSQEKHNGGLSAADAEYKTEPQQYEPYPSEPDSSVSVQASPPLTVPARIRKYLVGPRKPQYQNRNEPDPLVSQAVPFRGLLPFDKSDADRFFGRDIDTFRLADLIANEVFRFGVLYGESGCGKTSLIRAKLMPLLECKGYIPIHSRSYKDPITGILEECRKQTQLAPLDEHTPLAYIQRVAAKSGAGLIIICDQFEEFFINFGTRRKREPFISFVAACHHATDLSVRFLFSIRGDFLHYIASAFDGRVPNPLDVSKRYHLNNFDEQQAAEIIERSMRWANWPFEQDLCRKVASDLAVDDRVLPSELQIVGEQLQKKRISSVEQYERAGKKAQMVYSYLEDVIHPIKDRDATHLILRSLISEEDTRLTPTLDEIFSQVPRKEQAVKQILELFAQARLVRVLQDEKPWRYELMHEYLIDKINQITGRVMDATEQANRLLRQYMSNYAVDKRTRIPIGKLWSIRRHTDVTRSQQARELFDKSLRRALAQLVSLTLLLAVLTTFTAAIISMNKEWEELRLIDGHTAAAKRVVFSPDGRLLVSAGEDGRVIVWDFARRERLATFTDHKEWVGALDFSPDGKWFATGSHDHKVIVWDARRLEKAAVLAGHQSLISGLVFSPDAKLLATSSLDNRTIIWEVGQWRRLRELPVGIGENTTLLFSPDGRQLLLQGESQGPGAETWDVTTGHLVASYHRVSWNWAALSPDAARMVTIDPGGIVKFWHTSRFWDIKRLENIGHYPVHRMHGRAVSFSPDGRLVATGAEDIVLWNVANQEKLLRLGHSAEVWSLAFSPDGRWLVSTHADGAILVWDVAEREQVANFNEHSASVRAVAYSPDGSRLASASEDRSVIIWNTQNRLKEAVLVGHNTRVTAVAFSPDGSWVASSDQNGIVIAWDLATRRPRWTFKPVPENAVSYCLAISPDGRWVANSFGVYDCLEGHPVILFSSPTERWKVFNAIYGMAFSPNGQWLAYPTAYGDVVLWDTERWQLAERLEMTNVSFISISFSHDGKQFVTADDQGKVRLWSASPLRHLAVIGQHAARIKSVAFSPDGKQVASASDDRTIALWNISSRSLIMRIGLHSAPVLSVAFSPDGKQLASGEHDKSVRIYTRHKSLWGYRVDWWPW